ncbi:nucleoporin Nup186/Nup192/Nup205 [Fimicolochytrium jonesii]|uniref:nucleoporin Nup186/Nup192/Nup205 n=1 Tax=Fimicolochytrium jonesii TaxID=1396493 RepID=UPI0022FE7CD0|nr:nucleoporin Nup186/Nup192/Nup205 [Fimicolochytrium jonesii]KAI8815701.1 nucleoporin Nup186/Nup192/Nup205 [Fimicolochytrium jonesii]
MPHSTQQWDLPEVFHSSLVNYAQAIRTRDGEEGTGADPHSIKEVKSYLAQLRPDFVQLFKETPKSSGEREKLLRGELTLNGRKRQANPDFVQAVIFLSDLLGINELRAAELFQFACGVKSKYEYEDWSAVRVAVHIYHSNRDYALQTLTLMVTDFNAVSGAEDVVKVVDTFLRDMLQMNVGLPTKILQSMDILRDAASAFGPDGKQNGITSEQVSKVGCEEYVFALHAERLEQQRCQLGTLFFYLTKRWKLAAEEVQLVIQTLQEVQVVDSTSVSLLCSLLVAFDHAFVPYDDYRPLRIGHSFDNLRNLIQSSAWKLPEMQGVVWTRWLGFLHQSVSIESDDPAVDVAFQTAARASLDAESRKWKEKVGKQPSVYTFICDNVIPFCKSRKESLLSAPGPSIDRHLREDYMEQVERLIDALIIYVRWALKDIKCHDEDATKQADQLERRAPLSRSSRMGMDNSTYGRRPTAWESFLILITILYRDRPDAAVSFWEDLSSPDDEHSVEHTQTSEKQAFVRMASDVRTTRFLKAFIHMLASLATGKYSAHQVHLKLNAEPADSQLGSVLWTTFFSSLNSAIDILGRENRDLRQHEIDSIVSFLRLLSQVVKYSYSARRTLCDNQHLRAIHTLFWLLGSRIPVELKAALLDAIAAFCIPLGNSYDIQLQVWAMLEQTQIVPTMPNARHPEERGGQQGGYGQPGNQNEGILYDLEEIETANNTYPETLAFLRLLNILVNGQRDMQMASVFETLGAPNRLPGIRPYVRFVAEHVFAKSLVRRFDDPEERWEIIFNCLSVFDKCLEIFDLGNLTLEIEPEYDDQGFPLDEMIMETEGFGRNILQNAQLLGIHPGFEIMCAILSRTKITDRLFDVIGIGVDSVNESASRPSLCGKSVSLALQIILRVLQRQRAFLEILAPALSEVGAAEWIGLPKSMAGIDHILSFQKEIVVKIAEYIGCLDDEVCLIIVRILSALSQSAVYATVDPVAGTNRLLVLLQSSPSAESIIAGFVSRLNKSEDEGSSAYSDLNDGADPVEFQARVEYERQQRLEALVAENVYAQPWPLEQAGMVHAVRLAILDLLLTNLSSVGPPPTIAHFLLGYEKRITGPRPLQGDRTAIRSRRNCLTAILDLIKVPGSKPGSDGIEADPSFQPMFETHPHLAERCYHLIHQLCIDSVMSSSTMLYLRNEEDFFYSQLKAMPTGEPTFASDSESGELSALLAKLLQRTWLMQSVALELHVTVGARQRMYAQRLIEMLYTKPSGISGPTTSRSRPIVEGDEWLNAFDQRQLGGSYRQSGTASRFDVPLTKMLEVLNTMNFDEPVHRNPGDLSLATAYFPNLNLDDFLQNSLYDIGALHHYMMSVAESRSGIENTSERADCIKRILTAVLTMNQDQELGAARWHCANSWGQIVQVTLTRCFTLIPSTARENTLFDLLSTLIGKMTSAQVSPLIAETMSAVVLELLDKMHSDRLFQSLIHSSNMKLEASTVRLPTETLLHVVLQGIIRGILMAGASLEMRGNLYVALVRLLQYTKPNDDEILHLPPPRDEDADEASTDDTENVSPLQPSQSHLLQSIYAIISTTGGDKLFEMICRDAADGSGVWNIIAFVALDSICELASCSPSSLGESSKMSGWVLDVLVKINFLGTFVRTITQHDDYELRGIFVHAKGHGANGGTQLLEGQLGTDEDGSLNTHLLFEMKMAFLLRLSFQIDGARKLLEYGVIEALAECKYLDQRPESDTSFTGYDQLSVSANEQYHNVLVPALQLILSVAKQTQGEYNASASVASFVTAHRHLLVTILQDSTRTVTLSSLTQLQLVTGLLSYLADWKGVTEHKLAEAGHYTFHELLLNLLDKFISNTRSLVEKIRPTNRVEEEKDMTALAYLGRPSGQTQFRQEAEQLILSVCRDLVSYCVTVGTKVGGAGPHGYVPLFRPSFGDDNQGTQKKAQRQAAPTLGALCNFTSSIVDQLAQAADDHKNLDLKVSDVDRLTADEILLIAQPYLHDEEEERDLPAAQKRQLALFGLLKSRAEGLKAMRRLLYLTEHLLLLIWRHLVIMASADDMTPSSALGGAGTSRQQPQPLLAAMYTLSDEKKQNLAKTVGNITGRLQAVTHSEAFNQDAGYSSTRKPFLEMLIRQLAEVSQAI